MLLLVLGRSSCSKSDSAATASSSGKQRTVGVAFETLQTQYWVAGLEAIRTELQKRGISMLEAVADGDASRQLQQVRNFITRGVDGRRW